MGIDYCLVFDDDDAEHAFDTFPIFPLVLEQLDKLAESNGLRPIGALMHHDPESDPGEMFPVEEGIQALDGLIPCLEGSPAKTMNSFTKQEILEELVTLRDNLKANLELGPRFVVALVY